MHYDVFNGDADGLCALHQLRLHTPLESKLITGVKRDVVLLQRLSEVQDSHITVLDISMEANKTALLKLLQQNNTVRYFDHHFAGKIPSSPHLEAHIEPHPLVCTSMLVDRFLKGQHRLWAVVGAFGDNLHSAALHLARSLHLGKEEIQPLQTLGELLNYNGYGKRIEDLHFPPVTLYQAIAPYENPLDFCQEATVLSKLKEGHASDMEKAQSQLPLQKNAAGSIYGFPAEAWSQRVAGVFSNQMARQEPAQAHALLVDNGDGSHLVSVRAPLHQPQGADVLCREFHSGGGRSAAAGINQLPEADVERFFKRFQEIFTHAHRH